MIIELSGIEDLSGRGTHLKDTLLDNSHLLLRGLFTEEEVKLVRNDFQEVFRSLKPRGTTGVKPSEIVDNNLLKYSVGQSSGVQTISRLFMILYRKEEDLSENEKVVFERLVRVWEILQGRSFSKEELEENGSFFAKRYQFYPAGGGFFGTHADYFNVDTSKRLGGEFIQFALPITQKGVDFTQGGGYVVIDGKKIFNEDNMQLGDLIVYDGAVEHGVEDIDPFLPLDLDCASGRIVMFITLYKKLKD